MYHSAQYPSPLGPITLVCSDEALVAARFEGQPPFPHDACPCPDHPILLAACQWMDRYFVGDAPDPMELPLAPMGSPFRTLVWKELLQIPYGQSTTYGSLAREAAAALGKARMSAQAVGGAVGANPIAVIIPCHRVLGAKGALTGYTGGLEIKRQLLALEGIPFSG